MRSLFPAMEMHWKYIFGNTSPLYYKFFDVIKISLRCHQMAPGPLIAEQCPYTVFLISQIKHEIKKLYKNVSCFLRSQNY